MSIIDNALKANRNYAKRHDPKLGQRPAPKIAVVTCMDPRLSNLPEILGVPQADIDVIRTGGPAYRRRPPCASSPTRTLCRTLASRLIR
jgi:carbonic anhydrase